MSHLPRVAEMGWRFPMRRLLCYVRTMCGSLVILMALAHLPSASAAENNGCLGEFGGAITCGGTYTVQVPGTPGRPAIPARRQAAPAVSFSPTPAAPAQPFTPAAASQAAASG